MDAALIPVIVAVALLVGLKIIDLLVERRNEMRADPKSERSQRIERLESECETLREKNTALLVGQTRSTMYAEALADSTAQCRKELRRCQSDLEIQHRTRDCFMRMMIYHLGKHDTFPLVPERLDSIYQECVRGILAEQSRIRSDFEKIG